MVLIKKTIMATTTMTVVTESLNSVNVRVSNTGDTYKVLADVNVQGETIGNMENGEVRTLAGAAVANWSKYGSLNVNFSQKLEEPGQVDILQLINDFINGIKSTNVSTLTTISK